MQKGGETILIRAVEEKNWLAAKESHESNSNGANKKGGSVNKSLKRYLTPHKFIHITETDTDTYIHFCPENNIVPSISVSQQVHENDSQFISCHSVRKLSKMTEKMSKAMLDVVGVATGSVMAPVVRSQAGKKFLSMVPGEVLLASLDSVSKFISN